jgi:hypothetical protein
MRVEAYWNLHKHCISFRETRKGGTVQHAESLHLENVKFAVQPAGRAKVLRDKAKNVHAFVRGEVVSVGQGIPPQGEWVKVTYNPYKYDSFVVAETGEPIHEARAVVIEDKRIYAWT